jgi:hypothetical protein
MLTKSKNMETNNINEDDDVDVPEFDFSRAVPNKYAQSYAEGVAYEILGVDGVKRRFVQLDEDVAQEFHSSTSVNETLRSTMKKNVRRGRKTIPNVAKKTI